MSFLHLGYLAAGAAAVSIPVWIHLLLRQRARTVEIGSIRFVQQVVRRTKSRQRIQRWLLLLLRCLVVALLALLFARPYLPDTPADGSTREVAILLDRSASMRAEHPDGETAFDRARQRARQYVATLGDEAKVHVGLFDAGGVQSVSLAELDSSGPAATASDFEDAFAWAVDVLAGSSREDRELLLLSDLQRRAVSPQAAAAIPDSVEVRVEDPAPSVAQNLALESVLPIQVELRPKVPIAVAIRLFNGGAFPAADVPLELSLQGADGKITQRLNVSLPAGAKKTIEVTLPIEQPGIYQGEVTMERPDALPWDNRRFVAFEVRHPDRLLLVDGEAGEHQWENETYFLETALRLQSAVGEGPARTFEVERLVWDRGSGFPDLAGFRLLVLANLGRISSSDAGRLKAYLESGGNVLMFVGERTTAAMIQTLGQAGVLAGLEVEPPRDALERLQSFDRNHPALRPFSQPQHGRLQSLSVRRLMSITGFSAEYRVLLDGRRWPLAVAREVGDGQVVLFATTADRAWNDWPRERLYVPLMRQIAAWLTGQLDERQAVHSEIIVSPHREPGIETDADGLLVFNVDPSESDIGRMDAVEFSTVVGLPEQQSAEEDEKSEQYAPEGSSRPDEKWPLVVWSLLGLMGIEILLASRIHE